MEKTRSKTTAAGKVYLVGAGPGDPELLTLKAARLLQRADVIVHDGLVSRDILDLASPTARYISVAKKRSLHSVAQDQINNILIEEAGKGHLVVRLKGGDPFIFGRGGEEADDCVAAGVAVEVVPGISAALGCAAQARMPLTHRDASSAVSFVAGQCKGLSDQNWSGLAGKGRTLVIYMGVANAEAIVEKLIADGAAPDLPVAVLENGTRSDFRALRTLLTDLGDMVRRENVRSPALLVVGEVARYGDADEKFREYAQMAGVVA
ncbi:uroporphyrinogen-III C-methyltransferase [Sphingorhabdus sp. 109]|jgi:uroporphyrin-III C-methyltransferase|uniref:uroporphyrinogen-III C-methyltransferase n=1 Tax=Sphingorhabdus sp. 109 TaxID=2653173 RepID=UPI0012F0F62D|nr:uroporphyrinogen-III C-methyltransferase [Sphingorhabdus sp. 109]VWX57587.1 Uroporphyrinogen-III C-methyltransferase [Sphingorhabdus sp. 109]